MESAPVELQRELKTLIELLPHYGKSNLLLQLAAINKQCVLIASMVADSDKQAPWYQAVEKIQGLAAKEKKSAMALTPACMFDRAQLSLDDRHFLAMFKPDDAGQQKEAFRYFFGNMDASSQGAKPSLWQAVQTEWSAFIYPNPTVEGARMLLIRLVEKLGNLHLSQARRYKLESLYYAYRRFCQRIKIEQRLTKPVLSDMTMVHAIRAMTLEERNAFATHLVVWAQDAISHKEVAHAPLHAWSLGKSNRKTPTDGQRLLRDFDRHYKVRLLSEGNAFVFLLEPRSVERKGQCCILKVSQMLGNPDFITQIVKYHGTIRPYLNIPVCHKAVDLDKRTVCEGSLRRRLIVEPYYPQGSVSDYLISYKHEGANAHGKYLLCITLFRKIITIYQTLADEGVLFLDAKLENWFVDGEQVVIGDTKSFRESYNTEERQTKFKGLHYDSIMTYPYILSDAFFSEDNPRIEKVHAYLLGVQLFCALLLLNDAPEEPQDGVDLQGGEAYFSEVFSGEIGGLFQELIQKLTRAHEKASLSDANAFLTKIERAVQRLSCKPKKTGFAILQSFFNQHHPLLEDSTSYPDMQNRSVSLSME